MMDEMQPTWISSLEVAPYDMRAEREERLRKQMEEEGVNLTPIERLFDRITAARLTHYRPDQPPALRQDIICLCCGRPYRPDDVLDAENVFLCGSCILTRKENEPR